MTELKEARERYLEKQVCKRLSQRGKRLFEHIQTYTPWERTPENRLEKLLRKYKMDLNHLDLYKRNIFSKKHEHAATFWREKSRKRGYSNGRKSIRLQKRNQRKQARKELAKTLKFY